MLGFRALVVVGVLLSALTVALLSSAEVTFMKTYGGAGDQSGAHVEQTSDRGYIVTGTSDEDVYLLKTDSLGIEEWHQTYGAVGRDAGWCVQEVVGYGGGTPLHQ